MIITIEEINNFNELPPEIQAEVKTAERLEYRRFHCVQDILGYNKECIFCLAGGFKTHFEPRRDLFEVTSYGSDRWQWYRRRGLWQSN